MIITCAIQTSRRERSCLNENMFAHENMLFRTETNKMTPRAVYYVLLRGITDTQYVRVELNIQAYNIMTTYVAHRRDEKSR